MLNSKDSSRAKILQNFLPVLDDLRSLGTKYSEVEFAKTYFALQSDFENTLKGFGVSDFSAVVGEPVNRSRMKVASEEHDESAKGTVLREVSSGVELKGNVMKMAECVVSLGKEEDDIKEEEKGKEPAEASEEDSGK